MEELNLLSFILPSIIAPTPFTDKEKLGMNPLLFILADNDSKQPDNLEVVTLVMECIVLLCQKRTIREYITKTESITNLAKFELPRKYNF